MDYQYLKDNFKDFEFEEDMETLPTVFGSLLVDQLSVSYDIRSLVHKDLRKIQLIEFLHLHFIKTEYGKYIFEELVIGLYDNNSIFLMLGYFKPKVRNEVMDIISYYHKQNKPRS